MKILLDTNVVLDLLLAREPFVHEAREIFILLENDVVEGFLCATTVTTLHYLIGRQKGTAQADTLIKKLLQLFKIAPVTRDVLLHASQNNGADYEDAVIYTASQMEGIDHIITRDKTGFAKATASVLSPGEFLAFWNVL